MENQEINIDRIMKFIYHNRNYSYCGGISADRVDEVSVRRKFSPLTKMSGIEIASKKIY